MAKKCTQLLLVGLLLLLASQSPHAQTAESYVWQSVAIRGGGFVPGLVFGTVEKDVLYARTDMAGAYRWDAASYGWIPIMDWLTRPDMKYIGVESIAADPVDANVVYMAVGTYIGSNGQIIRSADRGDTWQRYNIATSMGGNADGRSLGERLMVDPNKTSILYFGSRTGGLWKSTDSAATWAKVASFPVTGTNPYGLSFVVFDKTSGTAGNGSSTIYVGVAATTAGTNLYRSIDAGATWTLVTGSGPPSGLMPHHGVLASDGNLWIAYNSSSGPNSITSGAVWKLNTAGDTWTNVNPTGHGGGIGGISVSASDPNYALASTLDWWAPDEIYRTTNGGTSWTAIGRNATHDTNGVQYLCFGPANCTTPSASGWAGDIEIDPFNQSRAFYVTGQGVWSSKNSDAASGIVWSFEDKNFEETVGLDLTSSVKTAIFAVVGDIGIIRTATDALDTPSPTGMVTNPKFGNGNSVDFAGMNPNIVADTGTGTQSGGYSTDNGVTWKPFASQAGGSKIAVGADGSVFVWAQTIQPTTAQAGKRARDSPARRVSHRIGSTRKSSMRSPTELSTPAATAQRHSPRPPRGCRAAGGRQQFLEWKGKSGWRPEAICTTRRARARVQPRSRVLHKCIRSASARPPRAQATPLCTSSAQSAAFRESFARPTKV